MCSKSDFSTTASPHISVVSDCPLSPILKAKITKTVTLQIKTDSIYAELNSFGFSDDFNRFELIADRFYNNNYDGIKIPAEEERYYLNLCTTASYYASLHLRNRKKPILTFCDFYSVPFKKIFLSAAGCQCQETYVSCLCEIIIPNIIFFIQFSSSLSNPLKNRFTLLKEFFPETTCLVSLRSDDVINDTHLLHEKITSQIVPYIQHYQKNLYKKKNASITDNGSILGHTTCTQGFSFAHHRKRYRRNNLFLDIEPHYQRPATDHLHTLYAQQNPHNDSSTTNAET